MKLPSDTTRIAGMVAGPTVAIIGALHGDETVGAKVITKLTENLNSANVCGEVFLILGNPKAYQAGARFLEKDMNRLFGLKFKADEGLCYEEKRALELAGVLENVDYLVDIHSTGKPSVPFVYCENSEKHFELAGIFETEFVVTASEDFRPDEMMSSADNFVDNHGGVGLTFETGWQEDLSVVDQTLEKIIGFLKVVGALTVAKNNNIECSKSKALKIYNSVKVDSTNFEFTEDFKNFYFLKKGGKVSENFIVDEDCYIIFPKKKFEIGKTACYLARDLTKKA